MVYKRAEGFPKTLWRIYERGQKCFLVDTVMAQGIEVESQEENKNAKTVNSHKLLDSKMI